MDRKMQQLGSAWEGLPADLLANVLEHLPRDDPGIAAIRQTCRWAQYVSLHHSVSSLRPGRAVHAGLWSAFSEPTGLTFLRVSRWRADMVAISSSLRMIVQYSPLGQSRRCMPEQVIWLVCPAVIEAAHQHTTQPI